MNAFVDDRVARLIFCLENNLEYTSTSYCLNSYSSASIGNFHHQKELFATSILVPLGLANFFKYST